MSISALALVLALAAPAGEGAPPPKPPAAEAGAPAPAPAPKPARLIIELRDGEGGKTGSGRCRVTVDGRAILPADAIMVGDGWFVVDGSLKMTVPPGECRLEVDGGPTRLPYDRTMSLTAGASEEKTIFLLRPEQYAFERAGWCLADPFYSAGTAGPEAAAAAARATGLAAVGLDSPELAAGRVPRWATRYPAICWKLDADPRYGSKITLSGGEERFTFYADCSAPRRVNPWKTLVPWRPELREFYDPMVEATTGLAPRMYYEFLAGTPVGGFEIDGSEAAQKLWFALLDHGWRVPAVAGSRRALSAGAWPEPRMLIRSEGRPETAKLVSALRAGRSTLSFGPYCFMAIEGRAPGESKGPGDEIALERGERRIMVRAVATTQRRAEIARIELWRNGKVIKTWQCAPGETVATVDAIAEMDEPGWVLAKCYQRLRAGDSFESGPDRGPETIAYTNPLWIVPKNYRGSLSPVETRLKCRILDDKTGMPIAAAVVFGPERANPDQLEGLKAGTAGGALHYECQSGSFSARLTPTMLPNDTITFTADGYAAKTIVLSDALGLERFAKRLAAMEPDKAVEYLSAPATIDALRQSMGRLDLEIRLQREKKK